MIKKSKKQHCIAAILAHADDLELNCGGTFAKYIDQGWKGIYGVLSLCNSGWNKLSGQNGYAPSSEIIPRRRAEAAAAARVFGAELFQMDLLENVYTNAAGKLVALDFPAPGHAREKPPRGGRPLAVAAGAGSPGFFKDDAVDRVAAVLIRNRPGLVICQTADDNNPDHFAAALIVHKAYRLAAQKVKLGPLYMGCSRGGFFPKPPDLIVDISGHEPTAEQALLCHQSQGGAGMLAGRRKAWRKWGRRIRVRGAEAFIRLL